MKNYYEILEIDENASPDDMKKSFRTLSKKYHPDKNSGDKDLEEKFKEVNEAYSTLSDSKKKQEYDYMRKMGATSAGHTARGSSDIYDMYRQFFKNESFSQSQRKKKNGPLKVNVKLSFEDSFFGCQKTISFAKKVSCDKCEGTGSKDKKTASCTRCNGSGTITTSAIRGHIVLSQEQDCPTCGGSALGKPENKCETCNGSGTESKKSQVTMSFPPGVEEGDYKGIEGGGGYKPGLSNGDVIFIISEIVNTTPYIRSDLNLVLDYKVKVTDLIGQDKIIVKHIDNSDYEIDLNQKKSFADPFVFYGKGFANRGHFLVRLDLQLPKNVSVEDANILKEISKNWN